MKEIQICTDCGCPLIWTFRWAYCEYYCLNCGALGDMFMGKRVKLTKELAVKNRVIQKLWKSIYSSGMLLPNCPFSKDNCPKCKVDRYHTEHLTKREIIRSKIALSLLKKFRGLFKAVSVL